MANFKFERRDVIGGKVKPKQSGKKNPMSGNQRLVLAPRIAFVAFLSVTAFAMTGMPVFATDIFGTAKNAMQTVYTDVGRNCYSGSSSMCSGMLVSDEFL